MKTELIPLPIQHEGMTWPLWRKSGAEEPLIRDLDWGERMGYARPRTIRKLIKSMAEAGRLGIVVRYAAQRTSAGGAPADEFYLTEAQALLVAAKSETEPAFQLLQAMVQVFIMARRGVTPDQIELRQKVAALEMQVRALRQGSQPVIGQQLADSVLRTILTIAAFRSVVQSHGLRSLRRREEQQIRRAVVLSDDLPLRFLPMEKYPELMAELYRRERDARKDALVADRVRQTAFDVAA